MGTLAPWCVNEKWEFGTLPNGHAFAKVTGRERCPDKYKKNPLWWFGNDFEQQSSDADAKWFHPDWPEWRRQLAWNYLRNPLQNASLFVLGIADRNYTVEVIEGWN